jgi:hypothetical protein
MSGVSTYNGDVNSLISSGRTGNWTSYVPTEVFTSAGFTNDYLASTNSLLRVSSGMVTDDVQMAQVALTGMTLCKALNDLGQVIDMEDAGEYFRGELGEDGKIASKNEYIVIVENMVSFKDSSLSGKGYWYCTNLTAMSYALGVKANPYDYSGTTGNYLEKIGGTKVKKVPGNNKTGYQLINYDNKAKQYLFNYWFSPAVGSNWSTNALVSTMWYQRDEIRNRYTDEQIWGKEFANTQSNNLSAGKFGFNVIASFYNPKPQSNVTITVEHWNDNTDTLIESKKETVEIKKQYTGKANDYKSTLGIDYLNNVLSYDQGITWVDTSLESTRTLTAARNTIIRFHYGKLDKDITVLYEDLDGNEVAPKKQYTARIGEIINETALNIDKYTYVKNSYSLDGGTTYNDESTEKTRTLTVQGDTVIRFQYAKDDTLQAVLIMTANPSSIEKGKTSPVVFTLDASQSIGKNIVKYDFTYIDPDDKKTEKSETVSKTTVNNTRVYRYL